MTVRYVGSGGNDGNAGTSWGTRKLTLNGVEDTPVVAGDIIRVGPGVYREELTCDVSGSGGSPIIYVADVTGENTDGVGGEVRITGSDDDQTATRTRCVNVGARNYRTFRGFRMDTTTDNIILINGATNAIIEDCHIEGGADDNIEITGDSQADITVRRCYIGPTGASDMGIEMTVSSAADVGHVIENCIFVSISGRGINSVRAGGVTVRNCLFFSGGRAVQTQTSTGAYPITVNNCIMLAFTVAMQAATLGDISENYNCLWFNATNRTNVDTGANSIERPPLFNSPLLLAGIKLPSGSPWELSPWSSLRRLAGTGMATDDFFGVTRPTTDSKKSWGPFQFQDIQREATTTQDSSAASIKLADAGEHQIYVPVTNESTTVSVYCYREADYAGTNPQMIIKQPGQSDRTTTDASAASQWNQLTDTLTPAANPPYVVVVLRSNNTATSGSYDVFFDTLAVS